MDVDVGSYRFSGTDVRRTIHHVFDLLDLYPERTRHLQAQRRQRLSALLAGVDPLRDDIDRLTPLIEPVWHELLAARDDLLAAGDQPGRSIGAVAQLNVGDGGVPKLPVDSIEVGFGGVAHDRQASRVHHGRPFQALCIWNTESIEALRADGHPIAAGSAGENITISGIEGSDVRPGVRLRIGSVLCEISCYALPCKQNAQWFDDGDFRRIHHERGPYSRVYATVIEAGRVATGDAVIVEP